MFDDSYCWQTLRPDVERLADYPGDPSFRQSRFWGPATDKGGNVIQDGFKMKWRQVGPGRVQLRLMVAVTQAPADPRRRAYLCQA